MDAARTLWTGFSAEAGALFEKTSAGFFKELVKAVGKKRPPASPVADVLARLDRNLAPLAAANVSKPTGAVDRAVASQATRVAGGPAANVFTPQPALTSGRLQGPVQAMPQSLAMDSVRPPPLDDLGAVNSWLRQRIGPMPAPRTHQADFPAVGPYGRVATGRASEERIIASTKGRLPSKRMTPAQMAQAKQNEGRRTQGVPDDATEASQSIHLSDSMPGRLTHDSDFLKGSSARWAGFADEFDKVARRRYFMPDGREVDLDILEPLLAGRSPDTATDDEITAAAPTPGLGQRMGVWMRQRLPFLFDEE